MVGFGVSNLLLGPSQLLNLPDSTWLIIGSQPLFGLFQVFIFIPLLGEIIERLQVDLEICEGEDEELDLKLNDTVNEVWYLLYALSTFFAPNVGTYMYNQLEMRRTCDIVAIFNFGFAIVLFIFNCGFSVFSEDRKFKQKLDCLKDKIA